MNSISISLASGITVTSVALNVSSQARLPYPSLLPEQSSTYTIKTNYLLQTVLL